MRKLLVSFLVLGALGGIIAACNDDDSPKAKEAKVWLDAFYKKYAIRGNWGYFGAFPEGKNVNIVFTVPSLQAKQLLEMPELQRNQFIAMNTCPPDSEKIWRMLDADGTIITQTRLNGNTFASTPCKTKDR